MEKKTRKNNLNLIITVLKTTNVYDTEVFKKLLSTMSAKKENGMIPEEKFLRYTFAILIGEFGTLWEAENKLRVNDIVRSYLWIGDDQSFIQSASYLFSYRIYTTAENFAVYFDRFCAVLADRFNISGDITFDKINTVVNTSYVGDAFPTNAPFYLSSGASSDVFSCSGGCKTDEVVEELDPFTMTRRTVCRTKMMVKVPFFPSTRRRITSQPPAFPIGKTVGRYKFLQNEKNNPSFRDGGMRKNGEFKADTDELPLITYVTVVYNNASTILRCMESIWAQNYPNIEYIVVDGASSDGTLPMIRSHEDKIDYFVSRPDSGIYDAMNTGISLASGRFICFMNSDDTAPPNAAADVVKHYLQQPADVIYGTVLLRYPDGSLKPLVSDMSSVLIRNNVVRYPCMYHQAVYGGRTAFEKVGDFDLKYRLASDLKWTNSCVSEGLNIQEIPEILAHFSMGGASDSGKERTCKEIEALQNELFPNLTPEFSEQLFFFIKRSKNEKYRSFKPLVKAAAPFLKDECFARMFYYTMIYSLYEEINPVIMRWNSVPYFVRNTFLEKAFRLLNKKEGWKVIEHPQGLRNQLNKKLSQFDAPFTKKDINIAAELKELFIYFIVWTEACQSSSTLIYDQTKEFERRMAEVKSINSSAALLLEREKQVYFEN